MIESLELTAKTERKGRHAINANRTSKCRTSNWRRWRRALMAADLVPILQKGGGMAATAAAAAVAAYEIC